MASDRITLTLSGDIPLDQFAEAMQHFRALIAALTKEVASDAEIEWFVEELQAASATTTIRGEAIEPEPVERVVRAYASVGKALEQGTAVPYSKSVATAAHAITDVLNGKIASIRFETPDEEATIATPSGTLPLIQRKGAFGSVEGTIETLSRRKGLKFVLYEKLSDRPVYCHLQGGQEELMRNAWGKRAIVDGWVSRDPMSGKPTGVRQIKSVTLCDGGVAGYREARGVLPLQEHGDLPEQIIRRLRDA